MRGKVCWFSRHAAILNVFGARKQSANDPGYDLIRRDESLGERALKNTSISSFGSWSKADEYVSSSTLRSGNASINLLSRGAIASRAIVMGQATRNKPEGLARFLSSKSRPSRNTRKARLQDSRYSFPASVRARPR